MDKTQKMQSRRSKVLEYIVHETMLKVGSEYIGLWVEIEPRNKQILAFLANKSKERNMFVAKRFIGGLVKFNGKHPVSTDGGTWYPMACRFLGLKHHNHSPYEKNISKELCNISKTEQNVLTTFLAEKELQTKAYMKPVEYVFALS